LAEKTFDLISVQDIAERSTLNRATFYGSLHGQIRAAGAMIGERFSMLIAAAWREAKGRVKRA